MTDKMTLDCALGIASMWKYQIGLDGCVHIDEEIAKEIHQVLIEAHIADKASMMVPDAISDEAVIFGDDSDDGYRMGWNTCRNAMLKAKDAKP